VSRLSLILLLLLGFAPARAQGVFVPPMPKDFEKVDVYLLTVGRGAQVHALFGHTILRIVDRVTRQDYNFNWGIFNFDSPAFAWTFYRGDLDYQLAIMRFPDMIDHYRDYEQRSVIQDRINLTTAQKQALMTRIIENTKPENVFYKYFQFRDNCATRVRDHLDAALGGRLREYFAPRRSPVVFRDHIRRNAAPIWVVGLGLDYLSNSMLDRPIGPWDEMFLPGAFRQHLLDAPAFGDDGEPLPDVNLLSSHQILVDKPEPPLGNDVNYWIALTLGIPTLIASVLALLHPSCGLPVPEPRARLAHRALGAASLLFGLWSSTWGTTMFLNWAVSYYDELQHNALLLVMFPVDWLFVAYGVSLLRSGQLRAGKLGHVVRALSLLHLVGIAALTLAWVTGLTSQNVSAPLTTTGLIGLALYATLFRLVPSRPEVS
jgi:hypothetical protein